MKQASEADQKQGFTLCPNFLNKVQGEYMKGEKMPCYVPNLKMIETILLSAEKLEGEAK